MDEILHNTLNFQKHNFITDKKEVQIVNLRTLPSNDVFQLSWNCYIHEIAGERNCHLFIQGCTVQLRTVSDRND